ncbi:MAG: metallophosphoesterase family protein [Pseudomonadota bacterium]
MAPAPIYAIGDVHGQFDMLLHALSLIEQDGGKDAKIVFVGDYTDRGPDSRAVVEYLIQEKEAGRPWIFLKGNHDEMFSVFVRSGHYDNARISSDLTWLHHRLGGPTTLLSYAPDLGLSADEISAHYGRGTKRLDQDPLLRDIHDQIIKAVPKAHLDFLEHCPLIHETTDLLFVHAGLRPNVPLAEQDPQDLIWIREPFFAYAAPFEKLIVHGHTAYETPQHFGNRVGIDGGAGYFRRLVPVVFEGRDTWTLTKVGRVALKPIT